MNASVSTYSRTAALATPVNKVLRNTYLMLTLMLSLSAVTAGYAATSGMGQPNFWLMLVFFIGMPMAISALRDSVFGLLLSFVFAGLLGLFMGPVIAHYMHINPKIPMYAFMGAAGIFAVMTGIAMTTKRDLSFLGSFLTVGFFVILGAIIANYFLQISGFAVVISGAILLISCCWILYSTQAMIRGGETNYIVLANGLFIDVWNLFLSLMRLIAYFQGED